VSKQCTILGEKKTQSNEIIARIKYIVYLTFGLGFSGGGEKWVENIK